MKIRYYQASDAKALTDIFYQTIHQVGLEHYTLEQVNAWAPLPVDYDKWSQKLAAQPPFVAVIDDRVVGFISLDEVGYIDWAFTHKDYQRKGIASKLYWYLEQQAIELGIKELSVKASYFARPFFEKFGFNVLSRNENPRGDQILINFTMSKLL